MMSKSSPWKVAESPDVVGGTTSTRVWNNSPGVSTDLNVSPVTPVSLADIMSEELAAEIQHEEEQQVIKSIEKVELGEEEEPFRLVEDPDCTDDHLLAQYLQHEFDREHDAQIGRTEAKFNKNDKVTISYEKYKAVHPMQDSDSSDEEDDDWREYVNQKLDKNKSVDFGPSGVVRQSDGTFVTKHDKVLSGRKNAAKVLDFPPEFHTGDAVGKDIQLPNNVYNELKRHSKAEANKHNRLHEKKEKSTAEMSVDANTRLILFKMVDGGLLDSISGSISTGKEAIVFHARGGVFEDGTELPRECALKVFKTTLTEFKNRCEYVKDDYRFKNPRKIMKIWAKKEMFNLNRMHRANIRCPKVVKLRKHVLVLDFVGKDGEAAPKLKDTKLEGEELEAAYDDCREMMKTMYDECRLVHADLSEFNILYWEDKCWFIDVSQAVDTSHPKSLVFLARDCHNLTNFFCRQGLEDIPNRRELFNFITDLSMTSDKNFYSEVQQYQVENRTVQQRKDKAHPADCTLRKQGEEENDLEELAMELLHDPMLE